MKICLFSNGAGFPLGKHNLKDPRLDQADKLVEAKKKTCVQVDIVREEPPGNCDAILVSRDHRADLILKDLEYVETRLGRNPPEVERLVLGKLKEALEAEHFVSSVTLSDDQRQALRVHAFVTARPITVAEAGEFHRPGPLLLRVYREAGFISFLTVGGKENRAWPIRKGVTAWEAAAAIHSDLQKGFIRAEIIGFDAFIQAGGETEAKRANKLRLETRSYIMQDYDLVTFRFSK